MSLDGHSLLPKNHLTAMDRPPGPSETPDHQAVLEHLGNSLRAARQEQGLSLSALAARLHMGEEQLRALEAADQAHLPETVFVMAQSRRVADALGIDVSPQLAPLKRCSSLVAQPQAQAQPQRASALPGLRLPLPLLGAVALLGLTGGALLWGWPELRRLRSATPHPGTAIQAAALSPRAEASELQLSSTEPSWLEVQTTTGAVLFQGTFQGKRRFPLNGGLRVKAGRPDLVEAGVGDQPPRVLGPIEQIRWVSFQQGRAPAPAP